MILLVGESNPYSSAPGDALLPWPIGAAGDRMRRILGMTEDEYLETFTRANVCSSSRWSMPAAVDGAKALLAKHEPKLVVALGVKVCGAFCRVVDRAQVGAFGTAQLPPWQSIRAGDHLRRGGGYIEGVPGITLLHMPHPSGRNRIWQTPGSSQRARDAFAAARKGRGV